MRLHNLILSLAAGALLAACDDSTTTVGTSLVTDATEIVVDSSFTVTGRSLSNPVVQSRTLTQLLGRLDAKEFGSFRSDVVTQFMPAMNIDTEGVQLNEIDSVKLLLFMTPGDFTGDSLAPMGLNVYKLNRQLPSPIFSDFDPTGYYSTSDLMGSQVYTANVLHSDSLAGLSYRTIYVDLPVEFGRELFTRFKEHPETFATPSAFAEWFPGLYISNTFGSGRVVNINETRMNLYYRKHDTYETTSGTTRDTIYNIVRSYLSVTPEVVTNNNIDLNMSDQLKTMIADGKTVIVAPTGTEVEIKFPAAQVISSYKAGSPILSVLNTLSFSIPASEIENTYGIEPPTNLLMVLASEKDEFFAKNKITDNRKSFMATYSATTKSYVFSDMRLYILDMMEKSTLSEDDFTFIITPVNVETETSQSSYYTSGTTYVTTIAPYVTRPSMANLDLEKAKIILTFSRQSAKN
ncbi:MAG: DUF4270 domain-containing protein [Paramuribaculum sp.]|nr:DUF4270 domain-containing protein [Paramuribaculum sp.]